MLVLGGNGNALWLQSGAKKAIARRSSGHAPAWHQCDFLDLLDLLDLLDCYNFHNLTIIKIVTIIKNLKNMKIIL